MSTVGSVQAQPDKAKSDDPGDQAGRTSAVSRRPANPSRGIGPDMTWMPWVRLWAEFAPGCLASHCATRPYAVPTRPR